MATRAGLTPLASNSNRRYVTFVPSRFLAVSIITMTHGHGDQQPPDRNREAESGGPHER
jgi:hypothetical protein